MQFISAESSALCLPSGICNTGATERTAHDEYTWPLSSHSVVSPLCIVPGAVTRCMG